MKKKNISIRRCYRFCKFTLLLCLLKLIFTARTKSSSKCYYLRMMAPSGMPEIFGVDIDITFKIIFNFKKCKIYHMCRISRNKCAVKQIICWKINLWHNCWGNKGLVYRGPPIERKFEIFVLMACWSTVD